MLFSLPGDSPAASKAMPATKSAPEKLRRTCQREKTGAGKEEDAGGLTPTKDDDAASVDFCRWQACCPLYTEGNIFPGKRKEGMRSSKGAAAKRTGPKGPVLGVWGETYLIRSPAASLALISFTASL